MIKWTKYEFYAGRVLRYQANLVVDGVWLETGYYVTKEKKGYSAYKAGKGVQFLSTHSTLTLAKKAVENVCTSVY